MTFPHHLQAASTASHLLGFAALAALVMAPTSAGASGPFDARTLERSYALPAGALVATMVLPSPWGSTQRFAQLHRGVPVLGGALAVRVEGGAVRARSDALARGLSVDVTPTIPADVARTRAESFGGYPIPAPATARLVVIPHADVGGYLAWQFDAWRTSRGPLRITIDAHDGAILGAYPLVRHVRGRVYATDPSARPVERDLPNLTSTTALDGRAAAVGNFVSGDIEQGQKLVFDAAAKPDVNGDYLFDPEAKLDLTDGFAQVNVYYHIERIDQFFRTSLGVPMGYGLQVVVNYAPGGTAYDNAFFAPYQTARFENLIVIGEGSSTDFAYDSDVFMHEFTHYVNANMVAFNDGSFGDQYGLNPMPGAIDEGTADYFATSVNDDPILGGAALAALGGQRDLTRNPGRCPDSLVGEVHADGELIGNATWRIRQAIGRELADPLIWSAIQLQQRGATFADFADGIVAGTNAAVTKGTMTAPKAGEVKAILDDLGLPGCGRWLEVGTTSSVTSIFTGLTLLGQYFGGYSCQQLASQVKMTSLFQYQYVAKSTAKWAKLSLALVPRGFGQGGSSTLDYSLYVRKGAPVTFTGSLGGQPYKASRFDFKVEHLTTRNGSISLGPGGVGDLEPGGTYYLAVLHANCPTMTGTLSVESGDVVPDTDAGVDTDGALDGDVGTDGGLGLDPTPQLGGDCSCWTAPAPERAAPFGLTVLVAASALARRRRRGT